MGMKLSKLPLNLSLRVVLLIAIVFVSHEVNGQVIPSERDILLATTGLGVAVGVELFAKNHFLPKDARYSTPNHFDARMRELLYLGTARQDKAVIWSDRLIYGVSLSSLFWGPALVENHERAALINMEVFTINSLATNLTKIATARERPYSHYGTASARGPVDFASFFSGHSSVAFSQAVSNAMILSEHHPENKELIWSSLLSLAGITAYLRVAGDMHYFSDIIVGAGVGSFIAWSITHHELKRFNSINNPAVDFTFTLKIPLG